MAAIEMKLGMRFPLIPTPVAMALANVALAICTFLTGILLARALGPEGRGVYGAIFLWAQTFANIFAWGGQITLARDAAQRPERAAAVYGTAYKLAALGGLIGGLAYLAIILPLATRNDTYPLLLVALASLIIPFSIPNAFQVQIELGRGRWQSYNLVRALFAFSNLAGVAALWLLGFRSVAAYLFALVATVFFASLFAGAAIRRSLKGLSRAGPPAVRETLTRSTPVAITLLLAGLAQQSDKLLASAAFSPKMVGFYLVAAAVAQVQATIGEALAQMFFTRAAAVTSIDSIDKLWLARRLRQTVLIYAAICIGALLFVPNLVPRIYGSDFFPAANLLYVLLPGVALQGMNRPFEEFLRGLNQTVVPRRMAVVVILCIAASASTGAVLASPGVLAMGVCVAFAASLVIAAGALGQQLGIAVSNLLVPKADDVIDLWHALSGRTASAMPSEHGKFQSGD